MGWPTLRGMKWIKIKNVGVGTPTKFQAVFLVV